MSGWMSGGFLRRYSFLLKFGAVGTGIFLAYRPGQPTSHRSRSLHLASSEDRHGATPKIPPARVRSEQLDALKASNHGRAQRTDFGQSKGGGDENYKAAPFDILVIGGLVIGASIALDAASRGLKVALLEKNDYGGNEVGSNDSLFFNRTRCLEEGIRKLDYSRLKALREAFRDRSHILFSAPHLATSLTVLHPVLAWWHVPYYWASTKLLDSLSGPVQGRPVYFSNQNKAQDESPMLHLNGAFGAFVRSGQIIDQTRLHISLAMTAASYGATVLNYVDVISVDKTADDRVYSVQARDLTQEWERGEADTFTVRARCIIDASGGDTRCAASSDEQLESARQVSTIVLPGYYANMGQMLVDDSDETEGAVFLTSWYGKTRMAIAKTGSGDQTLGLTSKDIESTVRDMNDLTPPNISIRPEDVLAAWSGESLPHLDSSKDKSSIHHSPQVDIDQDLRLVVTPAFRQTTGYALAEETVNRAITRFGLEPHASSSPFSSSLGCTSDDGVQLDGSCQLRNIRLIGTHGYDETLFMRLIQRHGMETDLAKHLASTYGDRSWAVASLPGPATGRQGHSMKRLVAACPFVENEIRYAVRHEDLQTAVDLIRYRAPLALVDVHGALDSLPRMIDIMAEELQWTQERRSREARDAAALLSPLRIEIDAARAMEIEAPSQDTGANQT